MSVGLARRKSGRHAAPEPLSPGIGDERDLALEHVDELILLGVPVPHRGLSARVKARDVDAEVFQPSRLAEASLVSARDAALVRLRVAGDRLFGYLRGLEGGRVGPCPGDLLARLLITALRTALPKV